MRLPLVVLLALVLFLAACAGDSASPAPEALAPTASPQPAPTSTPDGVVTIAAIGDVMLDRDVETLMGTNGAFYPFELVAGLLQNADLTIANFESALTDRGVEQSKAYTFRVSPRFVGGLTQAGIDVVSLGNNHTADYGPEGVEDTLAALDAAGVALATVDAIGADVRAARAQADDVVVSLHSGIEYTDAPQPNQRQLAHAAIDAGALLVLGSHPHTLQGWEHYGDGLIAYSLGNFVFDLDEEDLANLGRRAFDTAVLYVTLSANEVIDVRAEPVTIDPDENRPRPATTEEAAAIITRIDELNALVGGP